MNLFQQHRAVGRDTESMSTCCSASINGHWLAWSLFVLVKDGLAWWDWMSRKACFARVWAVWFRCLPILKILWFCCCKQMMKCCVRCLILQSGGLEWSVLLKKHTSSWLCICCSSWRKGLQDVLGFILLLKDVSMTLCILIMSMICLDLIPLNVKKRVGVCASFE